VYLQTIQQSNNVTIASYKICHVLVKRKKPFSDGEIVKEAMIINNRVFNQSNYKASVDLVRKPKYKLELPLTQVEYSSSTLTD
jgi:hypothetical protein